MGKMAKTLRKMAATSPSSAATSASPDFSILKTPSPNSQTVSSVANIFNALRTPNINVIPIGTKLATTVTFRVTKSTISRGNQVVASKITANVIQIEQRIKSQTKSGAVPNGKQAEVIRDPRLQGAASMPNVQSESVKATKQSEISSNAHYAEASSSKQTSTSSSQGIGHSQGGHGNRTNNNGTDGPFDGNGKSSGFIDKIKSAMSHPNAWRAVAIGLGIPLAVKLLGFGASLTYVTALTNALYFAPILIGLITVRFGDEVMMRSLEAIKKKFQTSISGVKNDLSEKLNGEENLLRKLEAEQRRTDLTPGEKSINNRMLLDICNERLFNIQALISEYSKILKIFSKHTANNNTRQTALNPMIGAATAGISTLLTSLALISNSGLVAASLLPVFGMPLLMAGLAYAAALKNGGGKSRREGEINRAVNESLDEEIKAGEEKVAQITEQIHALVERIQAEETMRAAERSAAAAERGAKNGTDSDRMDEAERAKNEAEQRAAHAEQQARTATDAAEVIKDIAAEFIKRAAWASEAAQQRASEAEQAESAAKDEAKKANQRATEAEMRAAAANTKDIPPDFITVEEVAPNQFARKPLLLGPSPIESELLKKNGNENDSNDDILDLE